MTSTQYDLERIARHLDAAIKEASCFDSRESFYYLKGAVGEVARTIRENPAAFEVADAPAERATYRPAGVPLSALIVAADLVRPELVDLR